jgi:hypothetical protein
LNVNATAPFGGPAQVVKYLGRYTHKVAITAQRITHISDITISFTYKDYADKHKTKTMCLTHAEFLRRFEQHILPTKFVKIRHSGFLSHGHKSKRLKAIAQQLQLPALMPNVNTPTSLLILNTYGVDVTLCPKCKVGKLIRKDTFINIDGTLVNTKALHNKGSPQHNSL